MKIAVIGAGYTGLVATLRFAQAGYETTLFEASDDVGGLAGDFKMHGMNLEKAYHFLYPTDAHITGFLEEMGMQDCLDFNESSVCCYYQGKIYPFNNAIDLIKFKPLGFIDRIRAGLVVLILQFTRMGWRKLARVTAYDWLRKWAGPGVTRVIWAPLLKGKFDKYWQTISMQWLWGRIQQRADSKQPGEKTERLGQIQGGFHRLTRAIVERIEGCGAVIRKNSRCTKLTRDSQTGQIAVSINGVDEMFDRVLFAGPSPVFANLIAHNETACPDQIAKMRSIDYLSAVLLVFSSDQEITPYYWHNISEMEWPFLVLINLTRLRDKSDFAGKHIYYLADYVPHDHEYFSMGDEELKDLWYDHLGQMFPDFDRSQLLEQHVFKFNWSQHIVGVGYEDKIPPYHSSVEGVYLSNFSQIFPLDRGTNLAIREGDKVAKMMMEDVVAKGGGPTGQPQQRQLASV